MKKLFTASLLLLSTLIFILSTNSAAVTAVSASDWDAGRIIDDAVFTNSDAMSAAQIQAFLNAKMPKCDNAGEGTKNGRLRATYSSNNPAPFTCLKQYYENPTTHVHNIGKFKKNSSGQYIRTSNGEYVPEVPSGAISAAQIIYDAGKAHGINPQVLLVTLQKEQRLPTDDWPWNRQYEIAMGYGCPDTAPCDEEYYGFYNQVNKAAWQFRRYLDFPDRYNYAVGNRYILYNPSSSCGGTTVNIRTAATAALYNYTPYQPNQGALNNYPGTASCGAYGNRNFWFKFNEWFGSVSVSTDYAHTITSAKLFLNESRTTEFTSRYVLEPGQRVYGRIMARNVGYEIWDGPSIKLGTDRPRDRNSIFSDSSWSTAGNRVAIPSEYTIEPSQIATFDFTLTAPEEPGSYMEAFQILVEGVKWMDSSEKIEYEIQVSPAMSEKDLGLNDSLVGGDQLRKGEGVLSKDRKMYLYHNPDNFVEIYINFGSVYKIGPFGNKITDRFILQEDGNLVLYDTEGLPLWNSETNDNPGAKLMLQPDANLVLYSATSRPLWFTSTVHRPILNKYFNSSSRNSQVFFPGQTLEDIQRERRLVLQSDGNLVLYDKNNRALWHTRTAR